MLANLKLCILVIGILPPEKPVEDSVYLIEHNRTYDNDGNLVYDQYIFWDFVRKDLTRIKLHVTDYFLADNIKDSVYYDGNHYIFYFWHDEKLYKVTSKVFYRTWTQYDPEGEDRDYNKIDTWPKNSRILLKAKSRNTNSLLDIIHKIFAEEN